MKHMTEPISTSAGAALGWKLAGFAGIFSAGVIGACVIAAVDPPKTRGEMFLRALAAGVGSLFFGPLCVRLLVRYVINVDLAAMSVLEALEYTAPVFLVVGCLSWGAFGALAMLSKMLKQRGADEVARRIGLNRRSSRRRGSDQ